HTSFSRDWSSDVCSSDLMKITAQDLIGMKIVDRIIDEPPGGAHADKEATIKVVGDAVAEELGKIAGLSIDELKKQRADRFYAIEIGRASGRGRVGSVGRM